MLKATISIIISFILISSAYSQDGVWIPSYKYNCDSPDKAPKTYNSGNIYIISGDSIFSVDVNNSVGSNVVGLGGKFTREDSVFKVSKSMFGFPWEFVWRDESNFVVPQNNECYNYTIVSTSYDNKVNPKFIKNIFNKFYAMSTSIEEYNYEFMEDTISFKNDRYSQEYSYKNIDCKVFEIEGRLFMAAFFIRPGIYPIVELDKNKFKLELIGENSQIITFHTIKISNPKIKEKNAFYDGKILIDENNDNKH